MPLLAVVYDACDLASRGDQQILGWIKTFFSELTPHLPLALILAFIVYGLMSLVKALLLRLHHVSVAAQASRHQIELSRPRDKLGRWIMAK
jgi:hypothetical protein